MTNKLLGLMLATSTFALGGCTGLIAIGIGALADSGKAERAEEDHFKKLAHMHAEQERELATLPEELDELEKVADKWTQLHRHLVEYRTMTAYDGQKHPSCLSKERKTTAHCKQATAMQTKTARKLAEVLHAAIDAKPLPGSDFPASAITMTQRDAELAALVDVEASLTKVSDQWATYWTKRVKKSGGAETLVRKEGTGMCFFSDTPQSNEIKPRFAFQSSDDMYIRCVATQPLASYQRTQKDTVKVSLINHNGERIVDTLAGDESSDSSSHTGEVAMASLRKATKTSDDSSERTGAAPAKPWRFAVVAVAYQTSRKVGTRAVDSGSSVRFEEDIRDTDIAGGIAIIDMEARSAEDDEDSDEDSDRDDAETASEDDDEAEDEPKAKQAKKQQQKQQKRPKAKQAKKAKKTARR